MAEINLSPYTAESEAIARRIKMAELLQQQSMQPLETPGMAGGYQLAISPYAGLAKILQGYTAGQAGRSAEAERNALGDRYQSDLISTLNRANQLSLGRPAVPEGTFKPEAADFQDNPNLALKNEMGVIPAVPAVAPNPEAAAREYFKHPATQAMGMNQLQKIAQTQQFINAGNAGNAPSGTSAPVAGVTPATSTSGLTVVPPVGSKPLASALANFGGPAGGQSMQAWLQVDPSGKTYLEQLAKDFSEANKPTDIIRNLRAAGVKEGSPQWNSALSNVNTAGGIFNVNEQGEIILAPGFAKGAGEIKGAETRATSENAISTREVGGRQVTGTDRQFKILATGEAPTEAEAQSVAQWAIRNGISPTIKGPVPSGQPATKQGGQGSPTRSGVANPTAAESAQSKEFATGSAAAITKKLDSSYDLAKNSVERITTINDLKSVLELPAFSGPGATTQLLLGQLANKFYGANNAEALANTTLKIQGLADLSLKAAGLIKGQGSVTEPERLLLAKAKSAPENLTVAEYKALFNIFEKQDTGIIKGHQKLLKRSQKAGVPNIDFWSVDVPIPQGLNLSPNAQKLLGGG